MLRQCSAAGQQGKDLLASCLAILQEQAQARCPSGLCSSAHRRVRRDRGARTAQLSDSTPERSATRERTAPPPAATLPAHVSCRPHKRASDTQCARNVVRHLRTVTQARRSSHGTRWLRANRRSPRGVYKQPAVRRRHRQGHIADGCLRGAVRAVASAAARLPTRSGPGHERTGKQDVGRETSIPRGAHTSALRMARDSHQASARTNCNATRAPRCGERLAEGLLV